MKGIFNHTCMEGVAVRASSPPHSCSHGIVERCNQELKRLCGKLASIGQTSWLDELPRVVFGMNCNVSRHGWMPYELVFGCKPKLPNRNKPTAAALKNAASVNSVVNKRQTYSAEAYGRLLEAHHIGYLRTKVKSAMAAFNANGVRRISFVAGEVVRVAAVGTKGTLCWSGPYLILGIFAPNYLLSNGMIRHAELLTKVNIEAKDRDVWVRS